MRWSWLNYLLVLPMNHLSPLAMFFLGCCHKHFQCFNEVYLLPTSFKSLNFLWISDFIESEVTCFAGTNFHTSFLQEFWIVTLHFKKISLKQQYLSNRMATSVAAISEAPRKRLRLHQNTLQTSHVSIFNIALL